QSSSAARAWEEENRDTPTIRRRVPAASDARRARRARVGPILPPAPRNRTSPSSRANASTSRGVGSLRRSSSSATVFGAESGGVVIDALVLSCPTYVGNALRGAA